MTTLSESSYPDMVPLVDQYCQNAGQLGMTSPWQMDCNVDLTTGSTPSRSTTPTSPASMSPSLRDRSRRSPKFSRSSGSSVVDPDVTMVGSPEEDTLCALVDEEFLNHYRVREIMDSLKFSASYHHTPQTAMFAASAYYDYYDSYQGGGPMSDLSYTSPDIKIGIEELCPVCGDKVSGYHYGLQTCESCKGFFKRTVQNKKVYSCVDNRNCLIDKTQRKRCPYCRFQKCISVGMKLEAVRADRMRGGRNKFGPMYKRDRALKQQAVRQRQQMFAQMQYSMQFSGLNGPGMPPGMMDSFGGMGPPDIKPNIAMLGLPPPPPPGATAPTGPPPGPPPPPHPGQDGSPSGPMAPPGNMMIHPYHPRQMFPMNSQHGDSGSTMSPGPHLAQHPPTSHNSSHGSYLPPGPPPTPSNPHSQPHYPPGLPPPPHMMSGMNSQNMPSSSHGPPLVGPCGPPVHNMAVSSGMVGTIHSNNMPSSGMNELSPVGIASHDSNGCAMHNGCVMPPNNNSNVQQCNSQQNTSGGQGGLNHVHGNGTPTNHQNSGDVVSMATGVPSIPSPATNSGLPQLICDLQKNEPDPREVEQKLSSIAEMMLQQQCMMSPEHQIATNSDGSSCAEVSKPILQLVCRVCDQALFLLVEWARGAYFFRDLRVEDQMKLLQTCWSELLILDFVFKQMVHSKPRHLVLGTGHMVSIDALDQVGLSDVKERLVDLASKFRELKLDHNEFTCLKFLILLNPDVVGLINRCQVEDYQKKVNVALLDYCNNFYPAIQDKFGQLLVRLPEIRLFSLRAEDYLYFQHISGNIPENTLLMEMLHSKRK